MASAKAKYVKSKMSVSWRGFGLVGLFAQAREGEKPKRQKAQGKA